MKNAAKEQNVHIRELRQEVQRDQREYAQDVNFSYRFYDPTLLKTKSSYSFEEVRYLLELMGHVEVPEQFRDDTNCFDGENDYYEVCCPKLAALHFGDLPVHVWMESIDWGPSSTVGANHNRSRTDSPHENQPRTCLDPQTMPNEESEEDSEPRENAIPETPLLEPEPSPGPPKASFEPPYPDRRGSRSRASVAAKRTRTRKFKRVRIEDPSSSSSSDEEIVRHRRKTHQPAPNDSDEEEDLPAFGNAPYDREIWRAPSSTMKMPIIHKFHKYLVGHKRQEEDVANDHIENVARIVGFFADRGATELKTKWISRRSELALFYGYLNGYFHPYIVEIDGVHIGEVHNKSFKYFLKFLILHLSNECVRLQRVYQWVVEKDDLGDFSRDI